MQLTKKLRIYPTKEQEEILYILSEECRLIYNFGLAERRDAWNNDHKSVSYIDQQNKLPEIKQQFPRYNQVNAKVLQMILRTLDANYKSFYTLIKQDPTARPPKFRGKKYFFTMKWNQSWYKLTDGKIQLAHNIKGKEKLWFDVPAGMKFTNIKQVEVFTDENKWYLSIVDEIEPPEYQDNGLYQAWDLGITKQTGVNLQGKFTEIKNIRPDKYWQKPITEVQSRRDHCKKGSRKFKFLNGLKRKMERKCRNQIKDFQHKTSLMIVKNTRANTIFIGDLDVKMMAQSKKKDMSTKAKKSLNRSTQGTGYLARFAELLTYKSEKIGKKAIEVSERYTTKKCCQCGKLHYMPVSKRVMICDCGLILDRDRNSSVNIMVEALSQNAMCTGYQQFVDNLRTGSGIIISPGHSQEAPSVRVA